MLGADILGSEFLASPPFEATASTEPIRIVGHRRRSPKDLAKAALKLARYLGRVELDA